MQIKNSFLLIIHFNSNRNITENAVRKNKNKVLIQPNTSKYTQLCRPR